jgi:APA family basic amino acid/polyamine antiporter
MNRLKRILSLNDLVAYGVGGTIGAGIFVSIGVGAVQSGPALFISFLLAAVACSISGLCFCEMASRVPTSGSSYSYALHVLGDFPAFVIGSVIVLDSIISAAACARAWSSYVRIVLPFLPSNVFGDIKVPGLEHIISISLLSGIVCIGLGLVLSTGIKETTWFNNLSTFLNIAVLAIFVLAGLPLTDTNNWSPLAPNGMDGIVRGSGRIFFAFLGFDVVNCLAEETGADAKSMVPKAIVLTILLTTVVYVLVSVSFIGLAPINKIDLSSPLSSAFEYRGYSVLSYLVGIGAVGNTLTSVLSNFLVQPRIVLRMAADGFLPEKLSYIDENGVPRLALLVTVAASTVTALLIDFETLADMVSVASLISLSMVCMCSIIVRTQPQTMSSGTELSDPNSSETPVGFASSSDLDRRNRFYTSLGVYAFSCCLTSISSLHNWWNWTIVLFVLSTLVSLAGVVFHFFQFPPEVSLDSSIFRVPLSPVLPLIGVGINLYLLFGLPILALVRASCVFIGCSTYYQFIVKRGHRSPSVSPTPEENETSKALKRLSGLGKAATSYDTIERTATTPPLSSQSIVE